MSLKQLFLRGLLVATFALAPALTAQAVLVRGGSEAARLGSAGIATRSPGQQKVLEERKAGTAQARQGQQLQALAQKRAIAGVTTPQQFQRERQIGANLQLFGVTRKRAAAGINTEARVVRRGQPRADTTLRAGPRGEKVLRGELFRQ